MKIVYFINTEKEDLKSAFRELTKQYHPDKGGNEEDFKKLMNEYLFIQSNIDKFSFPLLNEDHYNLYEEYYDDEEAMKEAEAWYYGNKTIEKINEAYKNQFTQGNTDSKIAHILELYFIEADNEYKGEWTNPLRKGIKSKLGEDNRAEKVYIRLLNYCVKIEIDFKESYITAIAYRYNKGDDWIKARQQSLNKQLEEYKLTLEK